MTPARLAPTKTKVGSRAALGGKDLGGSNMQKTRVRGYGDGGEGHVPLSGGVLDTVPVSGSDHAVMSSGLATYSSDLSGFPVMSAMERSEG
jgi:hypothetical protein